MDLKFDKEMDAILRKARNGTGAAVAASGHLDADTVAAFAENALPTKARMLYVEHFADCDDCRKKLSYTIMTNSEAVAEPASKVFAEAVETAAPWYSKFFRTPSLAIAMGALVLTFGGVLGFLVIQNRKGDTTVSQMTNKSSAERPYSTPDSMAAANSAANAANALTNTITEANTAVSGGTANSPAGTKSAGQADGKGISGPAATDSTTTSSDTLGDTESTPIANAPPPAPSVVEKPGAGRDEKPKDDNKSKAEDKEQRDRRESENRIANDAVPSPAKKTGPQRSGTGPRNNQNQAQMDGTVSTDQIASGGTAASSPLKTAGGKKFQSREGVWYDTSYHGQATTNVRRGTDAYQKLDSGLRSITNSIGGTVVVVWKSRAYRIN